MLISALFVTLFSVETDFLLYVTFTVFPFESFSTRALEPIRFSDSSTRATIPTGIGMTLVLFCQKSNNKFC